MTNIRLRHIEHYADPSSQMNFRLHFQREKEEVRMRRIHISSRDSSRTPVQWNAGRFAGFSTVKPWFYLNRNYRQINVAMQEDDPASILNFYRNCLKLRKSSRTLLWGDYREYAQKNRHVYVYERRLGDVRYLILCSFSHIDRIIKLPRAYRYQHLYLMLANYDAAPRYAGLFLTLRPYETRIYRCRITDES